MKRLACAGIVLLPFLSVLADGRIATLTADGKTLSGIREVQRAGEGWIRVVYAGGATTVPIEKTPMDFLESWGIKTNSVQEAANRLEPFEKALALGLFREVDGVVYDLRKTQPKWIQFANVKVIHTVAGRVIINLTPDDSGLATLVSVRNLPPGLADSQRVSFVAMAIGQPEGDPPISRTFDAGILRSSNDVHESLINGNALSAPKISTNEK
jgi:hypothetical protein